MHITVHAWREFGVILIAVDCKLLYLSYHLRFSYLCLIIIPLQGEKVEEYSNICKAAANLRLWDVPC